VSHRFKALSLYLATILVLPAAAAAKTPTYQPAEAPEVDSSASQPAASPTASGSPATSDGGGSADQIKSLLRQAIEKHSQGDVGGSQRLFRQILTIDPTNADANYNLGAIAEEHNDFQEALGYYQAASKGNPGDQDIRDAIASIKRQMGQKQAEANTAQQLNESEHLRQLGQNAAAAYKAGKFDDAIQSLQSVLKEQPNDANAYFGLGQAYRGKGDNARAQYYLSRAAALQPDNQLFASALRDMKGNAVSDSRQDQLPPAAPDYHPHRGDSHSDWSEDNAQQGMPRADVAENSGVQPFTSQGESQLGDGRAQSMGDYAGSGMSPMRSMGSALGAGTVIYGLGSMLNMLRGNSMYGSMYGSPYGSPSGMYGGYGYPSGIYGGYGYPSTIYPGYSSGMYGGYGYNTNPWGTSGFRIMRGGRHH
jgi:tetratricopeptide (TPR) repeat protein